MAINQSGIAIVVKAFLPTGKTLDEQFAALSIVKAAHETGDYAALLKAAQDVEVKTEAKTRRVEEVAREGANIHGIGPDEPTGPNPDYVPALDQPIRVYPDFAEVGDMIPANDEFALAAEGEDEPARASRKK